MFLCCWCCVSFFRRPRFCEKCRNRFVSQSCFGIHCSFSSQCLPLSKSKKSIYYSYFQSDTTTATIQMSTIISTGACREHKSRKKGPCPSCQGCRHCEPLQGCERRDHHIKSRVKRSNLCTIVPPSPPLKKQKKGLRSPENCKRGHFYDDTAYHLPDENCYDLPPNITKLTKLCELLELDSRFVDFV